MRRPVVCGRLALSLAVPAGEDAGRCLTVLRVSSTLRCKLGRWRLRGLAHVLPVLPRAVWRLLPGSSARYGPPRRWQSWPSYARERAARWHPAFPARAGRLPRPFWPPDGQVPFAEGARFNWPAQGVARIDAARVISHHGWCIASKDTFLGDFALGGNFRSSAVYRLTLHEAPRRLAGVTLNLCSAPAAVNFCHWMLDAVGRVALLAPAGISPAAVDHILLPKFPGRTAGWILARLNLPADKVIHPGKRDQFLCEQLLQPSYPGSAANYPPWLVDFYRELFPPPDAPRGRRRIYVARRGARCVRNRSEVEAELVRQGFELFEPAGKTDLHLELADVSHVVGVHGAALANLVFCRPGTRVLELLPSDMRHAYYYSLCASGDMPYGLVVGKSLRERWTRWDLPTQSDFTVPVDELRAALEVLTS